MKQAELAEDIMSDTRAASRRVFRPGAIYRHRYRHLVFDS